MDTPLVSICSITYNHAPYIRQCLDGFLMQKTKFRYEIIIHDDASTDGTTEIIKEYAEKHPDLITPIFQKENQYSKGIRGMFPRFCFPHAKGKYIALCEGDDYWTDPLKLQKQVDFLEANPDFVMCFTNAIQHHEDCRIPDAPFSSIVDRQYSGEEIFKDWIVPTGSVVFRSLIIETPFYSVAMRNNNLIFKDISLFLSCAEFGRIWGISDFTSVYRRTDAGAVSTQRSTYEGKMQYAIHTLEIYKVFGEKYRSICERIFFDHCYIMIQQAIKQLNLIQAYRFLQYSWNYSPNDARKFYLYKVKHLPQKLYEHLIRI